MDENGYPTDAEIQEIKDWPTERFPALMDYVRSLWKYSEWGFEREGDQYFLSTGGWSGNEELITALGENCFFWVMCWQSSRRGGHYLFVVV